jgi:hypothetical protein
MFGVAEILFLGRGCFRHAVPQASPRPLLDFLNSVLRAIGAELFHELVVEPED